MEDVIKEFTKAIIPWLLDHGLKIIIIAFGAWILNKVACRVIIRGVRIAVVPDSTMSREAELKREDTLIRIFTGTSSIAFLIIAVLMTLQEAGIEIAPILAGAGIVGLALGFGGQYLIRDIITGLFIILENQYRIGDVVNLDNTGGLVEDISLRKTTLRDLNGTVHHIPKKKIKRVANLSKQYARVNLDIGIAYSSNLEQVIDVINKTGNELAEDPQFKDSIIKPPQLLRLDDFGDSATICKILGDIKPLKQWDVTGEFRKRIKVAFDKEGIEIPFPQRVIHHTKEKLPAPINRPDESQTV